MTITLTPTSKTVLLNGDVLSRVWEGVTEDGIRIIAYIPRLAVGPASDTEIDKLIEDLKRAPEIRNDFTQGNCALIL